MSQTIGIIGLGNFGRFMANQAPEESEVLGFDESLKDDVEVAELTLVDLSELLEKSDIIILAVPLSAYASLLPKISNIIRKEQLLVDVCSVKMIPERLFSKHLPSHKNILITHPLFGPQTYKFKVAGNNRLIVTQSIGDLAEEVLAYLTAEMAIDVIRMSADDHDKLMADIHVLTFFIAKGLDALNLDDHEITTPSYSMITDLVKFSEFHTEELLKTIQNGNPYAEAARDKVVSEFEKLNKDFSEKKVDWG